MLVVNVGQVTDLFTLMSDTDYIQRWEESGQMIRLEKNSIRSLSSAVNESLGVLISE